MTERITHSSVTFSHDFTLRDMDGVQPPGTYLVETVEEPLGTLSFVAYRRVSTTITLPAIAVPSLRKQVVTIDPDELQAALAKDALATESQGARSRALASAPARKPAVSDAKAHGWQPFLLPMLTPMIGRSRSSRVRPRWYIYDSSPALQSFCACVRWR